MGIATHYLVGSVVGATFGVTVARVEALRVNTLKKSILLAILYVEILSQPLLATTPFLLKMTGSAMLQWYGGAFVMHLLAGIVLGLVVGHGLRWETVKKTKMTRKYPCIKPGRHHHFYPLSHR
jgi:hypothetical protein